MGEVLSFQEDGPRKPREGVDLRLDLDGYEGPIDVLLQLARDQKVDLARISILELAEQYLRFIEEARALRIEIAADYLVMAAWLAYLKSRLLLPKQEDDEEEPSGAQMAAALAFQLQRLNAMRQMGEALMQRRQLGQDFFARGAAEPPPEIERSVFRATLFELLRAYARTGKGEGPQRLTLSRPTLYSLQDAVRRLRTMLGDMPSWRSLLSFLPPAGDPMTRRSAVAATFAASLEMSREGLLQVRQDQPFGPIYVRCRQAAPRPPEETPGLHEERE